MQSTANRSHGQVEHFGYFLVTKSFQFSKHHDLAMLVAELVQCDVKLGFVLFPF